MNDRSHSATYMKGHILGLGKFNEDTSADIYEVTNDKKIELP